MMWMAAAQVRMAGSLDTAALLVAAISLTGKDVSRTTNIMRVCCDPTPYRSE
jgi:hypothetical protein